MKACDAWSRPFVLRGSRRKTADGAAEQVITSSPEVQRCSFSVEPLPLMLLLLRSSQC